MIFMKDEEFDKKMDAWASHEVESAPKLRPTEKMYRMIEAQVGKVPLHLHFRRILVGVAAACLILFVIIIPAIIYMSDHKPALGQREGFVSDDGIVIKRPSRRGGPKKGQISFRQLMIHYQKADSQSAYGFDFRFPQDERVTLTADDNYRLLIQPDGDRYVYAYQLDSDGELMRLFPNSDYNPAQNPLKNEREYYLPSEPNWLYLDGNPGEERIYVVASAQPMSELDDLYNQYDKTKDKLERQEILSRLIKEMEAVEETTGGEAVVWVFAFDHR